MILAPISSWPKTSILILYVGKQGVIQDFEVEGGNKKSNQKMLLKKGQLLFQYPYSM